MNILGEKRRRSHEPTPEIFLQGRAESSASASVPGSPAVRLPSIHVTETRRPRKKRKVVAFACDPETFQPPLLPGNHVRVSSPNPAPASTALALSSETTERTKSSTQVPKSTAVKPKSDTAKVTRQDDEAIVPTKMSRKNRKKKNGPPKGKELLPDHAKSARRDISPSPETQVKRVQKKAKKAAPESATGR